MHINKSKVLIILIIVSLWFNISLFVVPYTVPPGTIKDLNGVSNIVDFAPLWNSINPYSRAIYYFGDINCHQMSNRTLYLNGNEMPVCARDVSIFMCLSVGLIVAVFTVPSPSISEGVLNLFPKGFKDKVHSKKRGPILFALLLFGFLLLPTAFDGFRQLLTAYESTNVIRLITGAPCGFAGGFYLGVMITSVGETDRIIKQERGGGVTPAPPENQPSAVPETLPEKQ